jgi:carbamoyl-phosphate synthase/aspartate carbamoyltransferase/dihydroorotase
MLQSVATPVRARQFAESPRATPEKHAAESAKVVQDVKRLKSNIAECLQGSSVVEIGAMSNSVIAEVLRTAGQMQELVKNHGGDQSLQGKILATVFYEPSTRTNCSFQAAMLRLGGSVISVNESSSSVAKGETLADTVRCLECYADALVLRHPRAGAAAEAAAAMSKPLLNAGDGVGEHPTQALLDLYTIIDELSGASVAGIATSEEALAAFLKGKVVTMVGDLKNGRTVHSLAQLLGRFQVTIRCVAPLELRMPAHILSASMRDGSPVTQHEGLTADILQETDILYVTRVQKERFESIDAYDAIKDVFIITPDTLTGMRSTARIMHPLPRVGEIDSRCDSDPRAAYFRQMTNGMYVRMALLRLILG